MRKYVAVLTVALLSLGIGAVVTVGQDRGQTAIVWAYGFITPGPNPVAPPCSVDSKPHDCARPGRAWPEDGIQLRLPGSDRTFTVVSTGKGLVVST